MPAHIDLTAGGALEFGNVKAVYGSSLKIQTVPFYIEFAAAVGANKRFVCHVIEHCRDRYHLIREISKINSAGTKQKNYSHIHYSLQKFFNV